MNFVALCSTMSAPCSSGRWRSGVANVESTTTRAPAARAPAVIAGRSATSSVGFVGVSIHTTSAPLAAASTASVAVMSTGRSSIASRCGVLGEQAAHAEVADGRHDDDPRCERVHGGRRSRHPGREGDRPAALERADGVLEGRPRRRPVRAAVVAAAAHVRRQHDRLVQRLARRAGPPGDDGDRRRLPAWWFRARPRQSSAARNGPMAVEEARRVAAVHVVADVRPP